MLAQPFIENAIEHGVQHKKGRGNIYINLSRENHSLIFEIRDDGVGRAESMRINQKQTLRHKSFGTAIIEERIKLMNEIIDGHIKLEIFDLTDENNNPSGTKVALTMPIFE
jgi:sensor histidine kinase YesM